MKTIHAVYENGVFTPTEPVDLPEKYEVEFEPRPADKAWKAQTAEDLKQFMGTVKLSEDPMEYQRRVRGEWP